MANLVFIAIIALSILIALSAMWGRGKQSAKEFFVASRQFNAFLVFFLSAGEIYSVGTMVALPGGIYAKGPTYGVWYLAYILLAYPVGYFLGPKIWEAGRRYDAVTLPDLFRSHFSSRRLEILVAVTAIVFLLPWGQLQFTGLLAVMKAMGWRVQPVYLISICAAVAFSYLAIAGIRASAYIAVLKDILMVVAIIVVAVAVSAEVGIEPVFNAAHARYRSTMNSQELVFAMSTMLFQSIGFYVFPFMVQNLFTAKSANTIRRTQVVMPLYMLMYPFLILASYYALSQNLHLGSPNDAFFTAAVSLLPDWLFGLVAAAAALSGLVVLAGVCLSISSIVIRNLIPNLPEYRQKTSAKGVIVLYLIFSIVLTLLTPNLMTTLINTAYYGITQFLPGLLIVIFGLRVKTVTIATGMIVGQLLSLLLYLTHANVFGLNVGLVSLVVNSIVIGIMQLARNRSVTAPLIR